MKQYQDMVWHVKSKGTVRDDRTGTGTIGVFGYQNRYDLREGFPLMTTKKMPFSIIAHELFWFVKGYTNTKYLNENKVRIWNEDAYRWYVHNGGMQPKDVFMEGIENGTSFDLGPIYGHQWRSFGGPSGSDQITNLIEGIKKNPFSRRHIVSAWNPNDLSEMALPPCHVLFQFYVTNKGELSCQLYQRSADLFLGVPFNIASYALLTHMVAHVTGYKVGEFIHTFGDLHIYQNHLEQLHTQIWREPKPLPQLRIKRDVKDIVDFTIDDFELIGYDPHPPIKGKVSVG